MVTATPDKRIDFEFPEARTPGCMKPGAVYVAKAGK